MKPSREQIEKAILLNTNVGEMTDAIMVLLDPLPDSPKEVCNKCGGSHLFQRGSGKWEKCDCQKKPRLAPAVYKNGDEYRLSDFLFRSKKEAMDASGDLLESNVIYPARFVDGYLVEE